MTPIRIKDTEVRYVDNDEDKEYGIQLQAGQKIEEADIPCPASSDKRNEKTRKPEEKF
jgi:hypothetical protein